MVQERKFLKLYNSMLGALKEHRFVFLFSVTIGYLTFFLIQSVTE